MNAHVLATGLLAVVVFGRGVVAQQHTFLGRVLSANGDVIAGATVGARWCAAPELPGSTGWTLGDPAELGCRSAVTQTDESGRFRFELPVRGPVALVARAAAGTQQSLRRFPVMAGGFAELQLRAADFLAGIVTDGGKQPLAGLELTLDPEASAWTLRALTGMPMARTRITTDASGRFRHSIEHAWLAAPVHEAFAVLRPVDQALGFAHEPVVRPLAATTNLELVASSAALRRGVLRDAIGKPVPDGRVYEADAPWRFVATDAQGVFSSPARRVSQLVMSARGYSTQGMRTGAIHPREELAIAMLPSRRLAVRLLDEHGAPLAERDVLWSMARGEEPPAERRVRTDAEGRVAFDDAPVLTTGSGYVKIDGTWRRFLRRGISKDEDLGDLVVTWRTLDGQVTDLRGVPCAGVRVIACERDEIGPVPPCWVTYTNHGGRFAFASLPRREFTVLVDAGVNGLARCAVAAGDETCAVQLVAGRSFEVTVEDADGAPAAGAWVTLSAAHGAQGLDAPSPTVRRTSLVGLADQRGVVRFDGLPELDWTVVAHRVANGSLESFTITERLPEGAVTIRLRAGER